MQPVNKLSRMSKIFGIRLILWLLLFVGLVVYHSMYSFDRLAVTSFVMASFDCLALRLCSLVINRVIVPKLLYHRKPSFFIVLLIFLFILTSFLIQLVELGWYAVIGSLDERGRSVFISFSYQVFNTYLPQLMGCLGICAFRLLNDYWGAQNRYEELQKEKAKTELDFLKAQLNPHFLFNSLNSLYAEIEKTNPVARNILLKISEMLRYQLYECSVDSISIDKEIAYLKNYIEIERLRKNDNLNIKAEIETLVGFRIPPLLLAPFIENAFKYASNNEESDDFVVVKLNYNAPNLVFYCSNTRDAHLSRNLVNDKGIGIKNVKRRLELLYPGAYTIQIKDSDKLFEVELTIKIDV